MAPLFIFSHYPAHCFRHSLSSRAKVEESRGVSLKVALRDGSTSLDMTIMEIVGARRRDLPEAMARPQLRRARPSRLGRLPSDLRRLQSRSRHWCPFYSATAGDGWCQAAEHKLCVQRSRAERRAPQPAVPCDLCPFFLSQLASHPAAESAAPRS